MVDQIQYIGVNELKKEEKDVVDDLCAEYYGKLQRMLHSELLLKVRVKEYSKGGKPKFSIHIRAESPAKVFETSKDDWDIARTLHKTFNALMAEIEHAFHKKS